MDTESLGPSLNLRDVFRPEDLANCGLLPLNVSDGHVRVTDAGIAYADPVDDLRASILCDVELQTRLESAQLPNS